MPDSLIDKCLCDIDGSFMEKTEFINYSGAVTFDETFINELKEYDLDEELKELVFKKILELEPESSLVLLERNILHRRCSKNPAKFIWNNNIQRWLEVGKETEVDFLKEEVHETISNGNSIEIKLLIDLFKKNVLTKEQFLEQLQQKI